MDPSFYYFLGGLVIGGRDYLVVPTSWVVTFPAHGLVRCRGACRVHDLFNLQWDVWEPNINLDISMIFVSYCWCLTVCVDWIWIWLWDCAVRKNNGWSNHVAWCRIFTLVCQAVKKLESGRCFACRCGIEFGPFNVAGFPGRLRNNLFRLVLFVCSIAISAKTCYVYTNDPFWTFEICKCIHNVVTILLLQKL